MVPVSQAASLEVSLLEAVEAEGLEFKRSDWLIGDV